MALPSDVMIIAPFISLFWRARKVFWGVERTFLIVAFLALPLTRMLTVFEPSMTVFVLPPFTLRVFFFISLSVTTRS